MWLKRSACTLRLKRFELNWIDYSYVFLPQKYVSHVILFLFKTKFDIKVFDSSVSLLITHFFLIFIHNPTLSCFEILFNEKNNHQNNISWQAYDYLSTKKWNKKKRTKKEETRSSNQWMNTIFALWRILRKMY